MVVSMGRFLRRTTTIARREFTTAVATPAFVLFLLSPVLLVLLVIATGSTLGTTRVQGLSERHVAMIAGEKEGRAATTVDARLRTMFDADERRASLLIAVPSEAPGTQARRMLSEPSSDVVAVAYGAPASPTIMYMRGEGTRTDVRYLMQLTEQTRILVDAQEADLREGRTTTRPRTTVLEIAPADTGGATREAAGAMSILLVFVATYLLSGHIASGFAEERSSKIIEILASSAPIESVFFGKLLGELAVAVVFVSTWAVMLTGLAVAMVAMGTVPSAGPTEAMAFATGWAFPLLFVMYFLMSYLISSCTVLGLASLSATPRGAAIVNLPFSVMQFGMMSLAGYAASHPGTPAFWLAVALPFSSPLVMVGRGALSADLTPHVLALAWQAVWGAAVVRLAAGAFRRTALGGGGMFRRKRA